MLAQHLCNHPDGGGSLPSGAGFCTAIERVEPQPGEQGLGLEYSIAKLKASGFSLHNRYEDEIDATLVLCQKAFGKN